MKVAINGRQFPDSARTYIQHMFDELAKRKVEVQLSTGFRNLLNEVNIKHYSNLIFEKPNELFDAKMVISLGGDGTLLETVALVGQRQIPVLGINLGRLGFLATISPDRIEHMISALENGKYRIETRSLLEVESTLDPLFGGINFGLNDFAITKTDSASMITIHAYLNKEFLNSYWADGLIVSTPTGSTGYSLSCGGPVLMPGSKNFIVTPVSPHNLNVRPLIVEDSSSLRFEVKSRSNNYLLSIDSRSVIVDDSVQLKVHKAGFVARLLRLAEDNFLNTLRSKLSWGLDMRN